MNKDGHLYSIVFTFFLTAFFTAILAVTQAVYLPVITANEADVHRRVIYSRCSTYLMIRSFRILQPM